MIRRGVSFVLVVVLPPPSSTPFVLVLRPRLSFSAFVLVRRLCRCRGRGRHPSSSLSPSSFLSPSLVVLPRRPRRQS